MGVPQFSSQEYEQAYVLSKARRMVDQQVSRRGASTDAEEAKRKQVQAAPLYLRGRMKRDEDLPEIEIGSGEEGARRGAGLRSRV